MGNNWKKELNELREQHDRFRRTQDRKKIVGMLEEQHKTLKELDKVFCDSCGERKDLAEMKGRCVKCYIHLCNKCAYKCNKCKKIFCENHISDYVEKSFWGNKHYCQECSSKVKKEQNFEDFEVKKEQNLKFCSNCGSKLKNGVCPYCAKRKSRKV